MSLALGALVILAALGYLLGALEVVKGRTTRGRILSGVAILGCSAAMLYALQTLGNSHVVLFSAGALFAFGIGTLAARLQLWRKRKAVS